MTSQLPENPKRRVPDWRITLPLAQASPRCGARTQNGHALQGTSDGLREVQDAWGRQHWPTHVRGVGAHPEGPDDAWTTHVGDGQDARDGAGSEGWREAAGGAEMITVGGSEMHGAGRGEPGGEADLALRVPAFTRRMGFSGDFRCHPRHLVARPASARHLERNVVHLEAAPGIRPLCRSSVHVFRRCR